MCGILGGIAVAPFDFLNQPTPLTRATDTLRHRGPDDRGEFMWTDRRAFFGHRRLSIIDVAGGRQPIADETGATHFCYNGEIYNFRALRAELTARGHAFRTNSDGETALHLYQERPESFESRLNGMFALAILDKSQQCLTLVRDRLGIKPLYYWTDGRALIFASELKAILALLPRPPQIDSAALRAYLRWKYIPAPRTIYRGIAELPPATRLVAAINNRDHRLRIETNRYWQPDFTQPARFTLRDEAEAIDALDGVVRAAVQSHLESDVEVGALLSGGVDSSLVVSIAAQLSDRPIKTFCVGFREPGFDQLPFARTLAERCGTQHSETVVEVDPLATLPHLVRCFDQPFGDSSALASYHVCEVAARHVKVALTGDGGDEVFAGYQRYADLGAAVQSGRRTGPAWQRVAYLLTSPIFSAEAKFLRPWRAGNLDLLAAHFEREQTCGNWLINRLVTPAFRADPSNSDVFDGLADARIAGADPLTNVICADLANYLPGDILAKVDRTSMAHSLECRPPLLDHAVVEFSAGLADELKIHTGTGKYLLKRLAERYVPPELIYRKKRGFRVPIRRWFKGPLLDQTRHVLTSGTLVQEGVLDRNGIEWVLRAQRRPWMNLSSCLWSLLFLEMWARDSRFSTSPVSV